MNPIFSFFNEFVIIIIVLSNLLSPISGIDNKKHPLFIIFFLIKN